MPFSIIVLLIMFSGLFRMNIYIMFERLEFVVLKIEKTHLKS